MLMKIANSDFNLDVKNEITPEKALSSAEITERFHKLASEIKKIAPRSNEFIYFIARGIHAMEHSAIDPVSRQYNSKLGHIAYDNGTGSCKECNAELHKTTNGYKISGLWCKTSQVEPWINQNGDAFPEAELLADIKDPKDSSRTIKAYQTFVGKGLFTDHKSSEVENIRGIILDAEYDFKTKGVDLLIALDRVNYPELARQVSAGYSAQVSMGTQVNYSLCSICGNKAVTEHDYCDHVRSGKGLARAGSARCYEVNNGLNFIELSVVGNGADPRARIRTIIAQAQNLKQNIQQQLNSEASDKENQLIFNTIIRLESQIKDLQLQLEKTANDSKIQEQSFTSEILSKISNLENQVNKIGGRLMSQKSQEKKAYMQGTVEPDLSKAFEMADKNYKQYWEDDKHLHGEGMEPGSEGLHPGYGMGSDAEVKKMYQRASAEERRQIRKALLEKAKKAYMQGTVEPTPGKPFEMADKNYKQYWEDDKHLSGQGMESGSEGLHPGYGMGSDEQVKKELLRAKLRAKLEKFANPSQNKWTLFAGDQPLLAVTAETAYGPELKTTHNTHGDNQGWFDSKEYGLNLIKAVKSMGANEVKARINAAGKVTTAQAAPEDTLAPDVGAAPEAPAPEVSPSEEMSAAEGVKAAAERIESAKDEILALVDSLEGEAKDAGQELAGDLGAAGEELGGLGVEMGAPMPPAQANVYNRLVRYALANADQVLSQAEAFVENVLELTAEGEAESAVEKTAKKKLPEALRKHLEEKKKEKKEKKALSDEELKIRREARRLVAQKLYDLTDGDMIAEAHPEGGNTTTFPEHPEGRVETVTEAQEKDIEVAESLPRGELVARQSKRQLLVEAASKAIKIAADAAQTAEKAKAADDAQKLADQKKKELADAAKQQATASTVAQPTKTAEADKEAKQYYKELASESATGQKPDPAVGKFYTELTQDFHKKASAAATFDYGLKMKRAFAVAIKRANLGQIESSQDAINVDVDRLMNLDNESFTALAELVENTKKVRAEVTTSKQVRTAGALQVGVSETSSSSFGERLSTLPWK